ncbi:hypothetical protein ACQVTU_27350, partial [Bacillus cereus]
MKRYKVISATALAAMLVTGSSTFVFAAEKETTTQQVVEASHVFSPHFIEQTKNLDAIPMNNLDKAVQAALLGPEIKKLKVFDHEFNVKPAYISKLGNQTIVNGQISHHLSFRLDDQVYYRFVKEDGVIKNLEIKIDRGGWTKITARVSLPNPIAIKLRKRDTPKPKKIGVSLFIYLVLFLCSCNRTYISFHC